MDMKKMKMQKCDIKVNPKPYIDSVKVCGHALKKIIHLIIFQLLYIIYTKSADMDKFITDIIQLALNIT